MVVSLTTFTADSINQGYILPRDLITAAGEYDVEMYIDTL